MKLNHRQLEAFRAMIETNSVTEAAQRIHVTQPAASRLLSDLEYQIGYPLFTREKKRLTPTTEAMALYEEVDRSFIGLMTIAEAARDIGMNRRGALHIAGMPAMALEFLPRVIADFSADKPDVSIALQVHSSAKVLQSVASQQFDLGFSETDLSHPAVEAETLFEALMMVILPPDHALCAKTEVSAPDLAGERFISLGSNYRSRQRVDAIFDAANVQRIMSVETQLSFSAGQMVAQGLGVSIIDPITAQYLASQNLVAARPFAPQLPYVYQVLYPRHKTRSQLCTAFVEETHRLLQQGASA